MKDSDLELGKRSRTSDILSIYVPAFFIFLGMSVISPILPIYARSFNISFTLAAFAISIYAIGRFIADIPVGMIADRMGRKPLMITGTLILTVTSFLNALAGNFTEFLIYRLIQGIGSAMWVTSRQTLLADILRPEERGRILGYFQAFMLIGSSAGPTIGGVVASIWGLRAPFYVYSLTGLISFALTVVGVHEPKGLETAHSKGDGQFSFHLLRSLLLNKVFMMACLATFTVFFMRTGIRSTMIPLYASGVLGLDEVEIGTVISYATLMNLILTIPVGYGIDYFGRKPIIISSLAITAISALAFPLSIDYVSISIVAVLLGIGTSGAGQAPLAMATDATIHEPHGLSMGLYRFFGDIGFILGPIILGFLSDGFGLRAPFYFTGALVLTNMILILLFARETYRQRKARKSK